jgi:hypothetical protein
MLVSRKKTMADPTQRGHGAAGRARAICAWEARAPARHRNLEPKWEQAGTRDDIAHALACDGAAFVKGTVHNIDRGRAASGPGNPCKRSKVSAGGCLDRPGCRGFEFP